MTVGAASGMNVILKAVLNPGDEVVVFAPYFLSMEPMSEIMMDIW